MKKIFISAGEMSGDSHGSKLVHEIKAIDPSVEFIGMGSSLMEKEGVRLFADLTKKSTMGLIEPLVHIPHIYMTYLRMLKVIKKEKPDLVVVIDFQGYHMVLIDAVKKMGIPVVYYISPQEWQWGTEEAGKNVVRLTDKIISIFPEEAEFYNRLGGNAVYVGHPILDIAKSNLTRKQFYENLQIQDSQRLLTIFPGSRMQEIKHTFPVLLKSAVAIAEKTENVQIVVSVPKPYFQKKIKMEAAKYKNKPIILYTGNNYDLIAGSSLSLTKSGTITLEHAVMGAPFIAGYRFNWISYLILNAIFAEARKKMKYITLPNLLLKKMAYPEFIQDDLNLENITREGLSILNDPERIARMKEDSRSLIKLLGGTGVACPIGLTARAR